MESEHALDPVTLARRVGALAHCHNALLALTEARARVTMLGTDAERALQASMELHHRAYSLHIARLAGELIAELERVRSLAHAESPEGVIARIG